jgi:serine/threonine protein kinase/tetratricopeptide (TPR) repeat protein
MAESQNDKRKKIIKDAVQRFTEAQLRGAEPDIDEFARQYPGLHRQIKESIQDMQRTASLSDSLMRADERDRQKQTIRHDLVGCKVENFEIVETIGRGGMGVVYLARDTKLNRSVAIKSLPNQLVGGSTARLRLRREAKLLASLNHPNVAVIHDIIEQEEGLGYLVLEYVPGDTLAQRIARKPLKREEALSIGQQIAEAISAAHDKGVIHRDLKPGNIKITPEGRVKVLDFGLAKPADDEAANHDSTVTRPGAIIGTPAYMSPEQARGKDIDHRTDIWAFGCIMYEMLSGRLPFEGETATDTLASVIGREPDWRVLPPSTPMNISVLLRRCLEKDPKQRLGDIKNAALEISQTLSVSVPAVPAKSRKVAVSIGAFIIIVLFALAVRFIPRQQAQPSSKAIRLAVLPFENLGSVDDEYFADGLTDAITVRLAGIRGLAVISRQSAMQYKKSDKDAQQIGRELNVEYILEGTVQRERPSDPNSRVRVMPQLIRASDDRHVWAQTYDDDMSEVFRVQSDVAERVAQALDVTLLEPERIVLAYKPTENIDAYQYYLRGMQYIYQGYYVEDNLRLAIQMYEKAVQIDPRFALAYAQLSRAHLNMYWFYRDRSEERRAKAEDAVKKAFELNPDLPEVRLALGHYYYQGELNYDRALNEFEVALEGQPNNSEILAFIAFVYRRQGKFEQAVAFLKKASEFTPGAAPPFSLTDPPFNLAETYVYLRRFPEAESALDGIISLRPDDPEPYWHKARLYVRWQGSIDKARLVLDEALKNVKSAQDNEEVINMSVWIDTFAKRYQEALELRLSAEDTGYETQHYFIPKALQCARICMYMKNNEKLARDYFEEARIILEASKTEQPEDARFRSSLGITYAGLGRQQDAIREGELAVELSPVSKDAMKGPHRLEDLARIYVMVGNFDAAIKKIEDLLSMPSELSIALLRLDPAWEPLRNHPRFQRLIEQDK